MVENLNTAISDFSKTGLRTLLVAHKLLTDDEYAKLEEELHQAETALEKREEKVYLFIFNSFLFLII